MDSGLLVGVLRVVALSLPLLALSCGDSDDGGVRDGGADGGSDARLVDGRVVDGGAPDATSSGGPCTSHHDCLQKEFCHRGSCRLDELPVYHCGKPGCPPGHWCVEDDGRRDTCALDLMYYCDSACDCGPGHCCVDDDGDDATRKRCVRDDDDPWLGNPDPSTPSACMGEPTYCADAPECQVAFNIWERERPGQFLAQQPTVGGAIGSEIRSCGVQNCYGTTCNCGQPGQVCVDTVSDAQLDEGQTCGVLSGGSCVSSALAESVYRWAPREILACCDETTAPGERCDAGWFHHGNRWAYQRIEAVAAESCECGDGVCCPSEVATCLGDCVPDEFCADGASCSLNAECGNGICDPGEQGETCPSDCIRICGDGLCASDESAQGCPADCAVRCGDGICSAVEAQNSGACPVPGDCSSAGRCPDYREYSQRQAVCGDGVCAQERGCQLEEMESCRTCPMDCGTCAWELAPDVPPPSFGAPIRDVHVLSSDGVVAVGTAGLVATFDGFSWRSESLGLTSTLGLEAVFALGAQDVYVAGFEVVFHYGPSGWQKLDLPRVPYQAIWAADASHVFLVGSGLVGLYDGSTFTPQAVTLSDQPRGVWGSSARDVFVVGVNGLILHYDGEQWSTMASPVSGTLEAVWGSGPSNVYAVGQDGLLHFDGQSWQLFDEPWAQGLVDIWGLAANDVYVLHPSKLMHFDGASWNDIAFDGAEQLTAISGTASGDLFVSSDRGEIWSRRGGVWREENEQVGVQLNDTWSFSGGDGFVVGDKQVVLQTERAAVVSRASIGSRGAYGVWGSAPDDVFAVGRDAEIHHFDGKSWAPMVISSVLGLYSYADLHAVFGSPSGSVYAVGTVAPSAATGPSTVLVYRDTRWRKETVPDVRTLQDVWVSDNGLVFAAGVGGAIRYTPGGWNVMYTEQGGALDRIYGVWGTALNSVYFVGLNGRAWRFDGIAVRSIELDTGLDLLDVWGSSAQNVLAVGEDGTIMRWDGERWTREALDLRRPASPFCPDLRGIHGTSETNITVVGDSGVRLRPVSR